VTIGGELLRVTEEHPFWVESQGWTGAQDLEVGNCVRMLHPPHTQLWHITELSRPGNLSQRYHAYLASRQMFR
jgi:hypothetical protein